jgi:hypothetical protein
MEHFKIELITKIGTFKFENHFNSTADFYQAMLNFECNNYQMFNAEIKYKLFSKNGNGDIFETIFEGYNASCFLAGEFDEDVAARTQAFFDDQY